MKKMKRENATWVDFSFNCFSENTTGGQNLSWFISAVWFSMYFCCFKLNKYFNLCNKYLLSIVLWLLIWLWMVFSEVFISSYPQCKEMIRVAVVSFFTVDNDPPWGSHLFLYLYDWDFCSGIFFYFDFLILTETR